MTGAFEILHRLSLVTAAFGWKPAQAQDSIPRPAGDRLQVVVSVRLDSLGPTLFRLRYVVSSDPASEQSARGFVVRAPVAASEVTAPPVWVGTYTLVGDSTAIHWYPLARQRMLAPGAQQAGFSFVAAGLPEVVSYRVKGHADPPEVEEGVPVAAAPNRACQLEWLDSARCTSLRAQMDAAQQALAQGDVSGTRARVQAYRGEAAALGDHASALLAPNADFTLAHLAAGGSLERRRRRGARGSQRRLPHLGWLLKRTDEGPSGAADSASRESGTSPRLDLTVQ